MSPDIQQVKDDLVKAETELAFFMELGRALTATLDDLRVLEIIALAIHTYLKPSHTTLYVTGGNRRTYHLALARGYEAPAGPAKIPIMEGICGEVLRTGRELHLNNARLAGMAPYPPDLVMPEPPDDLLCIPIMHGKRPLAAILVGQNADAGPLTADHRVRLVRVLEQSRMAVDRALLYRKTADLAITDDLTQLFNHRYIQQSLDVEIHRGADRHKPLSLLFMDLDKFKIINDTHGHLAGSQALTEVAQILTDNLRTGDIIARYGGDEFVIILPETSLDVAVTIAERLVQRVCAHRFLPRLGGMELGASFGVACCPDHGDSPRKLVQFADQAMYQAKALGGNRVVVYHP
ncbi:MAG: sensor domain-containing diguanylate cyclase [Nitrospirae bacterium]|nr:sensor domain-containing diguanylate cyclase [Nitrospirota bacterium]